MALLKAFPAGAAAVDAEGNTPLHFAAACRASPAVVRALIAAHPEAAKLRGKMGRLPLSLALLCEAPPAAIEAIVEAFPAAVRDPCVTADYRNHGHGVPRDM